MSQFSNKIGILNTNNFRPDEITEFVNNSLKEQLSNISSESSKLVLNRLEPLFQSNQMELNFLNDNLARLKNNYKQTAMTKPTLFVNKSEEIAGKIKKIKRQVNEDNEFIQMKEINSSQKSPNNFYIGLNQCLNNMDEVLKINSENYNLKNISDYFDKLSDLTNYFLTQMKSLDYSIASQFENGESQREKMKEKLKITINKLYEIRLYFNKINSNYRNHVIEKENFNYINYQSQIINQGINNTFQTPCNQRNFRERDVAGDIQFSKFSEEDFSFYQKN